MSSNTGHEIVLLGCHHAGIGVAHYILRHTIPALSKLTPSTSYHLTVVAPHTEFFWNPASPRHILDGKAIPASKIYLPIAAAFKDYDPTLYTFVTGKASSVDPNTKTISIEGGKPITYSTLIVATGTTSNSILWQVNSSQDDTKAEFQKYIDGLPKAKTIVIAGGGAVGVECAGEIGTRYKQARVTLLSGSDRVLPKVSRANSARAESKLKAIGVDVVHNLRRVSSAHNADGTMTISMNDGSVRAADLFLDATGGKPNSAFLPKSWLNEGGYVLADPKTMRCTAPDAEGVYALGDVASYSDGTILAGIWAVAPACTSVGIDIAKKAGKPFPLKQKEYKGMKNTLFVPVGPNGGVGQMMGWSLPSFLVWLVKARSYFVWMAPGAVSGDQVKKP